MISSSKIVTLLLALGLLSFVASVFYRVHERFNIDHQQRLRFLKLSLILTVVLGVTGTLLLALPSAESLVAFSPALDQVNRALAQARLPVVATNEPLQVSHVLLGLYVLGLTLAMSRLLRSYIKMRRFLLTSPQKVLQGVALRTNAQIASPFSFGFLHPQIFMPTTYFAEQPERSVQLALAHEATHIRHHDPQWQLISLFVRNLLFFTPTAFFLHRKMELEMEVICDRVTMQRTQTSVTEYGHLLIDAIATLRTSKPNPMFAYMSDTHLRRRIQAMKTQTLNRPVLAVLFSAFTVIAGAVAIAATTSSAPLMSQYKIRIDVIVDGKVVSSPQITTVGSETAMLKMESEKPKQKLQMKVIATDFSNAEIHNGIDLKMAVDYETEGRSIQTTPRVIVLSGQEATISLGTNSGENLELKVNAERL